MPEDWPLTPRASSPLPLQWPQPRLHKVADPAPTRYCCGILKTEPPLQVIRVLRHNHFEVKQDSSCGISNIFGTVSFALYGDEAYGVKHFKERVLEQALKLKKQIKALIHDPEGEAFTKWYVALAEGSWGGELLLWLLEEVTGYPIVILRCHKNRGRWSRPMQNSQDREGLRSMKQDPGPFIGLYHAGGDEFHLTVPFPRAYAAGSYTHFQDQRG